MAYYMNGTRIDTNASIAQYASAAVNARFQGMNILTTLDPVPMTAGFDAYSSYALTGYKWSDAQINYVALSSLRRNITNTGYTGAGAGGYTLTNSLAHPRVCFVMFQAAGGAGGSESTGTGTGGGSGNYALSKVVLQPGSSFKVTHSTTKATITLVSGAAYMNGAMQTAGYSFPMTATAGSAGGQNTPGAGFRSGGDEEKNGGSIDANTLSHDGYTCPSYTILGGLRGKDRVSYSDAIESNRGAGGGGASAGPYLGRISGSPYSGGHGAFYYADEYNTYSLAAVPGSFGGGGGGGEYINPGAAGGAASSFVFF